MAKPSCAGRCTRTATSPPVTLQTLRFLIILFLSLAPVFWFVFVWSPVLAFVWSPVLAFVWSPVLALVCVFDPSVGVEPFAVVSACVTTTQFPSPAAVMNDTRQRFLLVPPAHLMPSGSLTPSCCAPWLVGA